MLYCGFWRRISYIFFYFISTAFPRSSSSSWLFLFYILSFTNSRSTYMFSLYFVKFDPNIIFIIFLLVIFRPSLFLFITVISSVYVIIFTLILLVIFFFVNTVLFLPYALYNLEFLSLFYLQLFVLLFYLMIYEIRW